MFAINAVDSGAKNFTAFTSLAKQLNGTTASASASTPSSTTGAASGASRVGASASAALGLVGAVFLLLL